MTRFHVTLRGASPLHLHLVGKPPRSPGLERTIHRCVFDRGRAAINANDIAATVEEAAYQEGGSYLRLATAILTRVEESRIPIASRGLTIDVTALVENRAAKIQYAGLAFFDWRLDCTFEVVGLERGPDAIRRLLEAAGRDVGLGYQLPEARERCGRFTVTRWERLAERGPSVVRTLRCA